jgi:hypothetical protein
MNSVDSKLPSVTKSFVDKLLRRLVKKCYGINFFKLVHFLKKSMACVNIAKMWSSISSLELCIVYFINVRFSLSIFTLPHCHATHSIVLLITIFHYVPHILILNKCRRGSSLVSSLRYSNDFFTISQILSNMLEINVYSIINSKMFGVTFGVNFLLSIVE